MTAPPEVGSEIDAYVTEHVNLLRLCCSSWLRPAQWRSVVVWSLFNVLRWQYFHYSVFELEEHIGNAQRCSWLRTWFPFRRTHTLCSRSRHVASLVAVYIGQIWLRCGLPVWTRLLQKEKLRSVQCWTLYAERRKCETNCKYFFHISEYVFK